MQKRLNRDHMLIHLLYQAAAAITYAFGTYTLLSRGFRTSVIGILLAVADLSGFFFQMFISDFLDNSRKYNVFQAVTVLTLVITIVYVLNYLLRTPSLALCIVYVVSLIIFNSLLPLLNSLTKAFNDSGFDIHFGVARAYGSFSFGITCIVFGFITNRCSYTYVTGSLILLGVLLFAVLSVTSRNFNKVRMTERKENDNEPLISYKEFLKNHRLFIIVCIGFTCILSGFSITENFMLPIVKDIGGTSLDSGIIQGIKAIFEVPVIYNYHRFENRFKLSHIMIVSGLSHVLKAFVLCVSQTLWPVYISQLLQCTSYALLLPASISYIDRVMSKREVVRGHAFSAMATTVIGTICNALGGYAIDIYGTKAMCYIAFFITMIGTVIVSLFIQKDLDEHQNK